MKYLKLYEAFKKNLFTTYDENGNSIYIGKGTYAKGKGKLELINSEQVLNAYGIPNDVEYRIYRTTEGEYILAYVKTLICVDYYSKNRIPINEEAVKKLIKKMKSYEFQKEYLTKHPDRYIELVPFGINPKIKKEFPSLARGTEWGFFDLERNSK